MSTSEDIKSIKDLERFNELSLHANDLRTRIAVLLDELHVFEGDEFVDEDIDKDIDEGQIVVPIWSIPIKANVLDFDFQSLASYTQFDVILMDPPWRLTSKTPTRGVAIGYQHLPDAHIADLPIPSLSTCGLVFIWTINAKYAFTFELLSKWGYTFLDDIVWAKATTRGRLAKGHGYYLQHAKESCIVGYKGDISLSVPRDVIFARRRGQSQKPDEIYDIIEEMIPNGRYLEIFGRRNNLRDYWVTIGNEL